MRPDEYERVVAKHFVAKGYKTTVSPFSNDYGVDVFATKGKEKIAVQAKMYGGSTRSVNRQMVMELHGAKDYFDCTKAVIATNGSILPDALKVADKLGVEVLFLASTATPTHQDVKTKANKAKTNELTFETIWEKYIFPLKGKTLTRPNGKSNKIINVDWSGIERITSTNKKGEIKIEIFKLTVNRLINKGFITRDEINQNYQGRASSGVVLILSQVPFFEKTFNPLGLKYLKK